MENIFLKKKNPVSPTEVEHNDSKVYQHVGEYSALHVASRRTGQQRTLLFSFGVIVRTELLRASCQAADVWSRHGEFGRVLATWVY